MSNTTIKKKIIQLYPNDHRKLKQYAAKEGCTMIDFITKLIQKYEKQLTAPSPNVDS